MSPTTKCRLAGDRHLALVVAGAVGLLACSSSPPLALHPATVDFGAVPEYQTVTASVTLVNLVDAGVTATYVRPGCPECFVFVDDAGNALFNDVLVSGLPVTLAPFASTTLRLQFYAGPESSPVGGGEIYYDDNPSDFVSLTTTGSVIAACNPPAGTPPVDGMGIGEGTNYSWVFDQADWQCVGATAGDAGLGVACISWADCPAVCCECPGNNATTCASFAAGGCIDGTCAPPAVACNVAGSHSTFCPDAGPVLSQLGGPGAFAADSSWSRFTPTDGGAQLNVVLTSADAGAICAVPGSGQPASTLQLALRLPSSDPTQSLLKVFPAAQLETTGDPATALTEPDGGVLSATGGYLFLSQLDSSGSGGSFDLTFGDGSAGTEIWGVFEAPGCP